MAYTIGYLSSLIVCFLWFETAKFAELPIPPAAAAGEFGGAPLQCALGVISDDANEGLQNQTCPQADWKCVAFACEAQHKERSANVANKQIGVGCVPANFCERAAFSECERNGAQLESCEMCDDRALCNTELHLISRKKLRKEKLAKDGGKKPSAPAKEINAGTSKNNTIPKSRQHQHRQCFSGVVDKPSEWKVLEKCNAKHNSFCAMFACKLDDGNARLVGSCTDSKDFCIESAPQACSIVLNGTLAACQHCEEVNPEGCNRNFAKFLEQDQTLQEVQTLEKQTKEEIVELEELKQEEVEERLNQTQNEVEALEKKTQNEVEQLENQADREIKELLNQQEVLQQCVIGAEGMWWNDSCATPCATVTCVSSTTEEEQLTVKLCAFPEFCTAQAPQMCRDLISGGRLHGCEFCEGNLCNAREGSWEESVSREEVPEGQRRCVLGHDGEWHDEMCPSRSKCGTLGCEVEGVVWTLKMCAPSSATEVFYERVCEDFDTKAKLIGSQLCDGDLCNSANNHHQEGRDGGTECAVGTDSELYNHTCEAGCATITCDIGDENKTVVVKTCGFPGLCNVANHVLCKSFVGGSISGCTHCTGDFCNSANTELDQLVADTETESITSTDANELDQLVCAVGVGEKWTNRSCAMGDRKTAKKCATLFCNLGDEKELVIKTCAPADPSDDYWSGEEGLAAKECAEFNGTLVADQCNTCDGNMCNGASNGRGIIQQLAIAHWGLLALPILLFMNSVFANRAN